MQRLLGSKLYTKIFDNVKGRVSEIRVRLNHKIFVSAGGKFFKIDYEVTKEQIDNILCAATNNSVYALSDSMNNGYINYGKGIRIGIAGEAVMDKDKIHSIKNISSLVIRIPFEAKGCSDFLPTDRLVGRNVLIVSPPYGGKTTLLRDLTRRISDTGKNMVVIDERYELAGGQGVLDLGECTDIIQGMPKAMAYSNAVRALNPSYIVTDELMGEADLASISDIKRCGIGVIATIHAKNIAELKKSKENKQLFEVFNVFVTLSPEPRAGTVVEVVYA
ncbi:MAG: hypothetical protein EOM87_05525 [Clostridia bacterium]|nr:hypothetical protein [Clostridia bacterium]